MVSRRTLLCVCVCILASICVSVLGSNVQARGSDVATPSKAQRTLIVVSEDPAKDYKQTHTLFFEQLQNRGHELTFSVAGDDPSLRLSKYGSFYYDNLILLCSGSEDLGEGLSVDSIQSFIDSGRSVLILASEKVSEAMREIVAEFGIDVDEDATRVQDHISYELSDKENTMHDLVLGRLAKKASRISGAVKNPVLFRGIGHVAQTTEFLTPVLTGSATAFSHGLNEAITDAPSATGRDVLLVSAVQTAGNARLVFSGSADLFSNALLTHTAQSALAPATRPTVSGNADFVRSLSMWCFHEHSLLRARDLVHYKIGAEHDISPASYRVSDHISFSVVIEEYDGVTHQWKPFQADDVQLEFTMLDPYIRIPLKSSKTGHYTTQFQAPDVYGVYKFVVPYHRVGYSHLELSHTVSVHPFRHNEYDRFIGQAYPYYLASFSIMAAFFVFGITFLYQKE